MLTLVLSSSSLVKVSCCEFCLDRRKDLTLALCEDVWLSLCDDAWVSLCRDWWVSSSPAWEHKRRRTTERGAEHSKTAALRVKHGSRWGELSW